MAWWQRNGGWAAVTPPGCAHFACAVHTGPRSKQNIIAILQLPAHIYISGEATFFASLWTKIKRELQVGQWSSCSGWGNWWKLAKIALNWKAVSKQTKKQNNNGKTKIETILWSSLPAATRVRLCACRRTCGDSNFGVGYSPTDYSTYLYMYGTIIQCEGLPVCKCWKQLL